MPRNGVLSLPSSQRIAYEENGHALDGLLQCLDAIGLNDGDISDNQLGTMGERRESFHTAMTKMQAFSKRNMSGWGAEGEERKQKCMLSDSFFPCPFWRIPARAPPLSAGAFLRIRAPRPALFLRLWVPSPQKPPFFSTTSLSVVLFL